MFPQHLRGYGTGVAALCQGVSGIWMGQITPYAFEAISWKYYFVFIGSLLGLGAVYAYFLVETNQATLEEIAGKYGDKTISSEKLDMLASDPPHAEITEDAAGVAAK